MLVKGFSFTFEIPIRAKAYYFVILQIHANMINRSIKLKGVLKWIPQFKLVRSSVHIRKRGHISGSYCDKRKRLFSPHSSCYQTSDAR